MSEEYKAGLVIIDKDSGQSISSNDALYAKLICFYEDQGELPRGFNFAKPCQLPLWPEETRAVLLQKDCGS